MRALRVSYYLNVQNTEGNTKSDSQQPTTSPDNQHRDHSNTSSSTRTNDMENTPTAPTQPSSSSSTNFAFKHRST